MNPVNFAFTGWYIYISTVSEMNITITRIFFFLLIDPCGLPVFLLPFDIRSLMSSGVDVRGSRITKSIFCKGKQMSLIAMKCNSAKCFHWRHVSLRAESLPYQIPSLGPQELHLDYGWLVTRNTTRLMSCFFPGNGRWRKMSITFLSVSLTRGMDEGRQHMFASQSKKICGMWRDDCSYCTHRKPKY